MAVRDLVGLFEAHGAGQDAAPRRNQRTDLEPDVKSGPGPVDSPAAGSLPVGRPARFLKHPLLAVVEGPPSQSSALIEDSTNDAAITASTDFATHMTIAVTDIQDDHHDSNAMYEGSLQEDKLNVDQIVIQRRTPANSRNPSESEGYELHTLLPAAVHTSGVLATSETTIRSHSQYRILGNETASIATTSTAVQTSSSISPGPHNPIPASAIFERKAALLYLPHLDDYMASLPAPSFPNLPKKSNSGAVIMFPPMDRLAALGRTLEDLEDNSRVAPWWRNRNTIVGTLTSWALGLTGSSALASFYSLHGLFDTIQIFALVLNPIVPHSGKNVEDKWRKLILGTIPNILAFNLATSTVLSLVLLLVFMLIAGALLYLLYRKTSLCCNLRAPEGLQRVVAITSNWSLVIISFLLTVLYLPLSTMAVHVLIWSEDLWVVPNPYINSTIFPPVVTPLGPPDQFRDPLDFCWTTTMQRNQINFAPAIIIISIVCIAGLTIWFPLHLRHVVRTVSPTVDKYTELGRLRSRSEMDREYQRLLGRDRNPLAFLYTDYRRGWGTYESVTLFAKLTALVLTAVVDPDNCLFRTLTRKYVNVTRQILLLIAMLGFFLLQCILAPFLDPVNNASEWTSRLNYVLTSAVSLAVALNIPGTNFFNGPLLYIIYVVTYGLSFYFAIINTSVMRRTVKRLARRIDFSIDIFSPRIDISPSSIHTKRRIWQEAISALFLTSPECAIPKEQRIGFAQSRDMEYPPYLYDFSGTPGERHVENLKILREVGSAAYSRGVALVSGPDYAWFQYLAETIQTSFVGPDCYWKDPNKPEIPGCTKFFGNAWWIPFPPTLVIRYDDGPLTVLHEVSDFHLCVSQNSSDDIKRRREIRMALRALDGTVVNWPYDHIQLLGSKKPWCSGRRYRAQTTVHFRSGVFNLKRRGQLLWEDINIGSGFDVELTYAKDVTVDGSIIGLNDDYELTRPLAHFFAMNEYLIPGPLTHLEGVLKRYRHHCAQECAWKSNTLTYRFLALVYDKPREPEGLAQSSIEHERDLRVRQLMVGSELVFAMSYKRLSVVASSEIATWWYIFWDDLWRRNHDTISGLQKHASDFNPHFPTSIAYTPLPRAALEAFLIQRGLFHKKTKWGDFFHTGCLNKMYLRMNDIVFHGSRGAHIIHLGDALSGLDMEEVDVQTHARPSTLSTGGGTDHDDESIRARPLYRWEGILGDKPSTSRVQNLWTKFGVWFGITPLWRSGIPSPGLALDVKLDVVSGRYVLLREDGSSLLYPPRGLSKFV